MKKITSFFSTVRQVFLVLSVALLSGVSMTAMAQTEISTEQGLRNIANNKAGSYKLTADIVLTAEWSPISGFTGTLDGNGHVIKGLRYDNPNTNSVGLFATTTGGSITKLGIENARLIGNADVGGIVGIANGTAISQCYVANSYIEGRDHVGSIAGALKSNATLTDSYGTAEIASRQFQVGGIAGIIVDATINRCYFSGLVYTTTGASNAGGIVSLIDGGTLNTISNSICFAPYIVGGTICKILAATGGRTNTLTNNYGLDALLKGSSVATLTTIPSSDANVAADKLHGAEVTKAIAQTLNFYTATMGWDMTNTWTLLEEGQIYPTLKWQTSPVAPSILGVTTAKKSITVGNSVTVRAFGSLGQMVTLTNPATSYFTESAIADGKTYTGAQLGLETVTVSSATKSYLTPVSLNFNLEVYDPAVALGISTPQDLLNMKDDLARKLILNNDVDMTGYVWTPIGTSAAPFTGTFDGNGHVIKGLRYNNENTNSVGLFAYATNATIKKLGIEDARLIGNADVAAIVGVATGTSITECYVANSYIEGRDHVGSIAGALKTGSLIENCYGTAEIASRQYQVSGIAGIMIDAIINKCHFSGIAYTTTGSSNAGGMVSLLDGGTVNKISNSVTLAPYMIGSTVCRILGSINGKGYTLENNYALDATLRGGSLLTLNTVDPADANVGVTKLHGANVSKAEAQTTGFYQTTLGWDMTNIWNVLEEGQIYPTLKWQQSPLKASLLGVTTTKKSISVGNTYTAKAWGNLGQPLSFTSPATTVFTSLDVNNGKTYTGVEQGSELVTVNSVSKPYLSSQAVSFTLEVFDPSISIEISTVEDLMNVSNNLSRKFILTSNIDLSSIADWSPIGTSANPFTGTFDGNGFTISNLKTIQSSKNIVGLFGVTTGATIKKLAVKQVNVVGNSDVAALVGKAIGTNISQVYVSGTIEGNDHVGALVGGTFAGGTTSITNCYSDAAVSTRSSQVGGLLGVASSTTLTNSYFSGTVTAPTTGWTNNAAGIVALTEDANVTVSKVICASAAVTGGTPHPFISRGTVALTDCFYRTDMVITGTVGNNGGTALPDPSAQKSVAELQTEATYTALGWDFATIWQINSNEYPTLIGIGTNSTTSTAQPLGKNYKCYVVDNVLHVDAVDAKIAVYNVSGILVKVFAQGEQSVKLPAQGVYIIRITEENVPTTVKVINK
jgi:hypothetical protein